MKAIVNTAPGVLEMRELPLPVPGPGQVRIRTAACAICATDLEMIAGWQRTGFPSVPGHEWSGWVDEVGGGVEAGLCGAACVAENVLSDGKEVGFEHAGGYGQYFLTEARSVHVLPADFPMTAATLIEPLAVCERALKRLGPVSGRVLVLGDGPIGLLTAMLIGRSAEVTLVGGRAGRLALAREFGARRTVNYHELTGPLAEALAAAVGGRFGAVLEATGSPAAMEAALALAGHDARILIIGDYAGARAGFLWNHLLHRELTLIGSNASAGGWADAVAAALHNRDTLGRLVTRTFPATDFQQAMSLVRSRNSDVVKVVMKWA